MEHEVTKTEGESIVESSTVTVSKKRRSPALLGGAAILLLVILAGGAYYTYTHLNADVVAIVNDTKITRTELDENIALITKTATLQGINMSTPEAQTEAQKQALDTLVNNALLVGAALASGVSADEAAVTTEFDAIVTQTGGAETFKTRLAEIGLTEEKLRQNIKDRIVVDQYLEAETDIESLKATDEEIEAFLASVAPEGTKLPPLEEIRPQVEAQIVATKQQDIVNALIEKLKSEGSIEVKI